MAPFHGGFGMGLGGDLASESDRARNNNSFVRQMTDNLRCLFWVDGGEGREGGREGGR